MRGFLAAVRLTTQRGELPVRPEGCECAVHQARAVCGASVVGDEEEHRDPDARSSGGDGLRPEVAAENEIIEEFEPEDEDNREEGEEAEEPSGLRKSRRSSETRTRTHTPYRAWCRHCVRARGRNAPHRTRTEEQRERQVPKVSMNYFFMSQADEKADKNPLIVMMDESTGERSMPGPYWRGERNGVAGEEQSEEMKSWGHSTVTERGRSWP